MPKGWVIPRGTLWCSNGRLGCWTKKEQMAQQARFIIFLQQRYFAFSLIVETSGTWVLVVVLAGGHNKQTRGPNLEETHIVIIYREHVSRTLILIQNAASPKMVSFSLSPQNTDSPTRIFPEHLHFFCLSKCQPSMTQGLFWHHSPSTGHSSEPQSPAIYTDDPRSTGLRVRRAFHHTEQELNCAASERRLLLRPSGAAS